MAMHYCQMYAEGRLQDIHLLWKWRWYWRSPRWIWTADMSCRHRCLRWATVWKDNRTFLPFKHKAGTPSLQSVRKGLSEPGVSSLEILSRLCSKTGNQQTGAQICDVTLCCQIFFYAEIHFKFSYKARATDP